MRNTLIAGLVGLALAAGIAGCGGFDNGDNDRDHGRDYGGYGRRDDDRIRENNQRAGDRNTRIEDRTDDGRLNDSARSYEERKASRAADEGDRDAARREAQLRRERQER